MRILFAFLLLITTTIQAQSTYEPPRLSNPRSWTMVLFPDPQSYVKFARNQPILELMTNWVVENRDSLNIGMVLCTGDLVEQNDIWNPDGVRTNQTSKQQWEAVARAFGKLDGKLPYILTTGNHDYGFRSAENRKTQYWKYFPADKNYKTQELIRGVATNADGNPSLENASFEYVSPHGKKMLFLVLEFAPRDTMLNWAKQEIAQPKYKDHEVVLLTHSYLNKNSEHITKEKYVLPNPNWGADIFKKLVQPSTNIRMVFSGHIGAPDDVKAHLGFRIDKNASGKSVNQMTFNAQALGGGWHGNGGDGWLRILEFLPDGKTVLVKTFSPLFAISPSTRHLAWRTDPWDQFSFTLE